MLFVFIAPWFIWWRLVDKRRTGEILAYGLLVAFLSTTLDEAGITLRLWTYTMALLPLCVQMKPVNVTLLPVMYMFIYQYFPHWKTYIIAAIIQAAFLAFVGEQFLVWFGIYKMLKWRHLYSFPIYIAMAVFLKLLTDNLYARRKY